jgi:hypothetical protein
MYLSGGMKNYNAIYILILYFFMAAVFLKRLRTTGSYADH